MLSNSYQRPQGERLAARLREPRRFLQVVSGPRQVGKTTLVRQVAASLSPDWRYASADEPTLRHRDWLVQQWEVSRLAARQGGPSLLVLDEIQKISAWSETVKRLWDEDTAAGVPLQVVLLGSAPLLVQHGLSESLAGRFETLHLPHWSLEEMRDAFGWDLEQFLAFGGYPGSVPLIDDAGRWRRYIVDSLIETALSRDVLLLTRVDKPALLRQLFLLAVASSGQVLSYTKMLGQLQDAGNTTTLAHYLELLSGAGLVTGLQKYAGTRTRQRGSSPKLQVLNTALMTAPSGLDAAQWLEDPPRRGRLVESAVGAHLAAAAASGVLELFYWREGNHEVDFVVRRGDRVTAVEVKSGARQESLPGMTAFSKRFEVSRSLLVGADGIPVGAFLSRPVEEWIA